MPRAKAKLPTGEYLIERSELLAKIRDLEVQTRVLRRIANAVLLRDPALNSLLDEYRAYYTHEDVYDAERANQGYRRGMFDEDFRRGFILTARQAESPEQLAILCDRYRVSPRRLWAWLQGDSTPKRQGVDPVEGAALIQKAWAFWRDKNRAEHPTRHVASIRRAGEPLNVVPSHFPLPPEDPPADTSARPATWADSLEWDEEKNR